MSDMIELAHIQFNAIASRTITFAKDGKPVYVIEAVSDRCSDAFLPINSINHNSEFYDVIANFVKKYNGNSEVPFNYVSRFYLKDMSSGKEYAFILNDTAYYAKNRVFTSMDYIKAYLGDDPDKWNEFAKMIKTETMPFEGIVYSVSRDGDHVIREKNDWKRDRHLLFAPYGETEFRPNKFKHLLTNSLEGVEVKDQNDA